MIKYIDYVYEEGKDPFVIPLTHSTSGEMQKVASASMDPKIASYIAGIKPDPKKLFVLINAMGAGEFYGSNVNGDYFEEKELAREDGNGGYTTFKTAGVYRHHKNKDPEKSMGKIACCAYNEDMHRVELVVEIDREKAASLGHGDLIESLDKGEPHSTSMGCKVKYDVCSICENKSKTRDDYCEHAKEKLGSVLDDGRKVYVKNPEPKLFDISFVSIGADKTSFAMHKIASAKSVKSSADNAVEFGIREAASADEKVANQNKISEMLKRVPATVTKITPALVGKEKAISHKHLKKCASYDLSEVLTTSAALGIVLTPAEYQTVILTKLGHEELADLLSASDATFAPSDQIDSSIEFGKAAELDSSLVTLLSSYTDERSAFEPYISKRVLTKAASERKITTSDYRSSDLLDSVSASYNGYRVGLLEKMADIISDLTNKNKNVLCALGDSYLEDSFVFNQSNKTASSREAMAATLGLVPLAYLYGAYVNNKRSAGEKIGSFDAFVEKHPAFSAAMAVGLARLGVGLHREGVFSNGIEEMLSKVL